MIKQGLFSSINLWKIFLVCIAVCLSIFQLYQGIWNNVGTLVFRPVHLTWVMVLIFLYKPLIHSDNPKTMTWVRGFDFILAIITIIAGFYVANFDYNDQDYLMTGLLTEYIVFGVLYTILLLECTRRTVGIVMVLIAGIFILYLFLGYLLPDSFASAQFDLSDIIASLVYSTDGIFGSALGISATTVFIYVLFGALLQVTGAGQFFIDCAFAVAGKYRGGPAKASVIASAALGSISGSAIANTVTTGALTIPMMKKLGYKSEQAAGIEAAASTGGQIMPPVMGAGAFVMAQFTGIPYSTILLVSIAPAILYFSCTLLYVHIMACKLGLKGMTDINPLKATIIGGWHFIFPLILITVLLLVGYQPVYVGVGGCLAILIVTMLRSHTRIKLKDLIEGLKEGALGILPISAACATAGIVVGVVGKTGIAIQMTQFLLVLSGGHLWATLLLIGISAIILGMGLPVTAAYIVLSVIAVDPLISTFGIPLLVAHLFIFWLSQTSNVTPPIALAAFAGAGIAKCSPMKAAIQAFKLAQGFFLIPAMMIYSELIFDKVPATEFILSIVATIGVIITFASFIEGYLFTKIQPLLRLVYLVISLGLLYNNDTVRMVMIVLAAVVLTLNYMQYKRNSFAPIAT